MDFKDLNKIQEFLLSLQNAANQPLLNPDYSENKVQLIPDKTIGLAKFKPHPTLENSYLAHPQTIKAVRVDIFMAGDDFADLHRPYECLSCSKSLDLQFWKHCPYCEAPISKLAL